MATYLVTGAAGFIGSNLVRALRDRGESIIGVDNFETGKRENVSGLKEDSSVRIVEDDLRDFSGLPERLDGVDYVLHQAAVPSVPRSIANPRLTVQANCLGTTNLLTAAKDQNVTKVVVASSSSVYGPSGELPRKEDQPVDPVSPYALSKYFTEKFAVQFDKYYDLETVALRYFNVFGPRQDPKSEYAAVVPKFVNLMLDGRRPEIYGDGEQSRDFTYVDNVVRANRLAAESDCSGAVFNVGCGSRTTVNELTDKINDVLDTDIDPVYGDSRPGDVKHSHASIEKARRKLDYDPAVSFEDGLERTIEYYQNKRS